MSDEHLDLEIELIESSLLPAEQLIRDDDGISITSDDSKLSLRILISPSYPTSGSVDVEVKNDNIGREEALGWKEWSKRTIENEWDPSEEYPLYQLLTTHLLPLIARESTPEPTSTESTAADTPQSGETKPHHVLLTSHHLIAPSKRKDLNALSSQLSLVGFAKVGHPGIIYAIGSRDDLVEWVREVKSWQWLALRVRVSPEPIEEEDLGGKGKESGARGGKGRGEWIEVEKVGDAVEWMRRRGREKLLTDLGIGVGA